MLKLSFVKNNTNKYEQKVNLTQAHIFKRKEIIFGVRLLGDADLGSVHSVFTSDLNPINTVKLYYHYVDVSYMRISSHTLHPPFSTLRVRRRVSNVQQRIS